MTHFVPGVDAGLGDGDAALLHHLVDCRPVNVGHLVEFVDADNTPEKTRSLEFSESCSIGTKLVCGRFNIDTIHSKTL